MRGKNSPEIRFPGFGGEWEQMKLGEVVEIKDSARISNTLWVSKGVPYLRSSDLANDEIVGELFISDETYQSYKDKTGAPEKDDVLFTSGGKVGVTYHKIDDNPVYVQGGSILYAKTSTSNKLSGIYLKAFFSSPTMTKYIEGASTGLTIKHFTLKPANAAPIFISSLKEQNKIGELFKQIDDTIAFHQQELTTLKQTKQGFLQKMFPKEGESVPEVRFPGFTGDWEKRELKDVVDLLKDGTHGTHKDGKEAFLLSAKNIKNGQIIIDELTDRKISSDDYNSIFKNYGLMDQDLLITIVGTIGQTALYTENITNTTKIAFQRSVAIVRGNKDVNQIFLKSIVDSNHVQKQLKQSASMSAQAGVYLGDLAKLTMSIPKLSEQIKIGNFIKQLDDIIALHQRELDALKETKKAFLQKMFV